MKPFNSQWFERMLDDYVAEHFGPPTHVIFNPTAFAEYFESDGRPRATVLYYSSVHGKVWFIPSPYLTDLKDIRLGNSIMALDYCFGALWHEPAPIERDYSGWTLGP